MADYKCAGCGREIHNYTDDWSCRVCGCITAEKVRAPKESAMTTSNVELLPCPFCGSDSIDEMGWASTDSAGPACDDCGASAGGVARTLQDNIAAWNRRATAAKDAEVEELRAEVERLTERNKELEGFREYADLLKHKVITCGVAADHPDAHLTRTGAYASKWNSPQAERVRVLRDRAERLAEALRIAIRQNSHDMLMTGDELRQCEAAISPTAAQGDEAASA